MEKRNKLSKNIFLILALCFYMQGAFAFQGETWKVLVYMQADNDLSEYAKKDLLEMQKGLSQTKNILSLVELDLPGDEGSFRYVVNSDYIDLISIQSEYEPQKEKLLNFILWAQELYPTDKTMVVIWGHGEGWTSNMLAQFGGVALDQNPKSRLSIKDLQEVFEIQDLITNNKINFLSMDACLMQTIEVASEFSQLVSYISGSSQIQNFNGLQYDKLFQQIERSINSELASEYHLALNFSNWYIDELMSYASIVDQRQATISVINTDELLGVFIPEFNETFELLDKEMNTNVLLKMRITNLLKNMPSFLGHSRDMSALMSYLVKMLKEENLFFLAKEMEELQQLLNQSVMSYSYGNQYIESEKFYLGQFKAFGIWFPANREAYLSRKDDFTNSRFFNLVPAWKQFLESIFAVYLSF